MSLKFSDCFLKKMAPADSFSLPMSKEFRELKRSVLTEAFPVSGEHRNRIMVTSTESGCGKTFIAYNLARSVALEQDKTVLLVQVDVNNPDFNEAMKVGDSTPVGLIDFLTDVSMPLNEALYHTDIDKLKVIPLGNSHYLANELFSSGYMNQLMNEFQVRYPDRLVIIDAPSLCDAPEALAIVQHVDQVLIIVSENVSTVSSLKNCIDALPKSVTGKIVLNKTK